METLLRASEARRVVRSSSRRAERLVLAGLLYGVFAMGLGTAWDIQWHASVGRESFWIPPHTFVYSGAVTAGVVAMLALARSLGARDSGGARVPRSSLLPKGLGTAAIGSLVIAAAAVFDDAWHRTVGDHSMWSPPHALGVAGAVTVTLGTMIAVFQAGRRGIVSWGSARVCAVMLLASILSAAHFALVGPAVMAFDQTAAGLRFFFFETPYLVAGLASLLMPAMVACHRRVLGRFGFEAAAAAGGAFWGLQELFHLYTTPAVASVYGYALKAAAEPAPSFVLLVLGFMLLPALMVHRAAGGGPRPLAGGLMGGLYAAEVAVWLGAVGAAELPAWWSLLLIIAIGAASAAVGDRLGQWIRATSFDT